MKTKERWIVLGVVAIVVASVAYLGLQGNKADPKLQTASNVRGTSEALSNSLPSTSGGVEIVKPSQLPRMLELGSVG
jgi:hypothetical protein